MLEAWSGLCEYSNITFVRRLRWTMNADVEISQVVFVRNSADARNAAIKGVSWREQDNRRK